MPLAIGSHLGSHEIIALLGKGGMGEVYRARDARLKREVAIKILPEEFSRDPDRVNRFQREAEVLASLNHPNIAAIYDIQEDKGLRFLVLELVEGNTLADKIRRGPLSISETLGIAEQICDALEAAHDKSVIHRDLKPANIKITPDGKVKLLDFGLARIFQEPSQADLSNSPTIATGPVSGIILGTAGYMSPEQAKGEMVDRRSDIWAFGCVLYEMLTGQRAFEGKTLTETLGAVMHKDIEWAALPRLTARNVRDVLRRCLQKDCAFRLRDIGDVRIELTEVQSGIADVATTPRRSQWVAWAAAAVFAAAAAVGFLRPLSRTDLTPNLAFSIVPAAGTTLIPVGGQASIPEISPDGSSVLDVSSDGFNIRRFDALKPLLLSQLLGALSPTSGAFWAADSKSVVVPTTAGLMRVRIPDGAPEKIAALPGPTRGGTWNNRDTILIAASAAGGAPMRLFAVQATGGELKLLDVPGLKAGGCLYPEFLPGSDDFLFFLRPREVSEDGEGEIYLATLRDGKATNPTLLRRNTTAARYTPAGGGRVLFVRNDNLYSQTLNLKTRKLEGEPQLIHEGAASGPANSAANFSVSQSGVVALRPGKAALSQVTIFDRQGNEIGKAGPPGMIASLALSPDDTRLLADGAPGPFTWLFESGQSGRVTLEGNWVLWSADGSKVLGGNNSRIRERSLTGSENTRELVDNPGVLQDISPDGKDALFFRCGGPRICSTHLEGSAEERLPRTVVQGGNLEGQENPMGPRFSPDGRWIVYSVGDQGLFVQPFPSHGLRRQIANLGVDPVWRKDGKEIIYRYAGGVWSIRVDAAGTELDFAAPQKLFSGLRTPAYTVAMSRPLAVSRDGSRIYFPQAVEQANSNVIHVRMGWFESNAKPQ